MFVAFLRWHCRSSLGISILLDDFFTRRALWAGAQWLECVSSDSVSQLIQILYWVLWIDFPWLQSLSHKDSLAPGCPGIPIMEFLKHRYRLIFVPQCLVGYKPSPALNWAEWRSKEAHTEGCQTGASAWNKIIMVSIHTAEPPFYLVIFNDSEVICLQKSQSWKIFDLCFNS